MHLIKGGNAYLGSGRWQKLDIMTRDGTIVAMDEGLDAGDAMVIDAAGKTVLPGFVLPLCAVGIMAFADKRSDKDEVTDPVTPHMNVRHSFDFGELMRQHFCRAGITSYGLSPGTRNLLGGQLALINTAGDRLGDLFLREAIALKGNFTESVKQTYGGRPAAPMTRMGMFAVLDEAFRKAGEHMEADKPEYNPRHEALVPALRGEVPVVLAAHTESEIESVLDLAERHSLRLVVAGAFGLSDACAQRILDNGWHVVLGDSTYYTVGAECGIDLPRMLHWRRRGMNLALGCSGDIGYIPGYEQLSWMTGLVRQAGATADEALDMLTIAPAKALGVESLVGSLAVGHRADLLICQGNPAERYDGRVLQTLVAGQVRYSREEEKPC